ncbi:hypothetical protein [Saccharopolyspora taberi]|uniref:Uncharacterized protein n=1 Tax=Saccharopolyspora taberi TaxID=60895 RepID=A0ABN3V0C6_9PSEU
MTIATPTTNVSDDLLATFDRITDAGKTLPLTEIKKRFATSEHFRYRAHQLYRDVITLPLTIGMVTGEQSDAVSKIVAGLREMHGDELVFAFSGHGDEATMNVRLWRDETTLRALWNEYAEDEYKTTVLSGNQAA